MESVGNVNPQGSLTRQMDWSSEPRHGGELAITRHWDASTEKGTQADTETDNEGAGARPGCLVGCIQPVAYTLAVPGVYCILFHFTLCWLGAISVGYSAF